MRKIWFYLMPLVAVAIICMGRTATADTITLTLTNPGQSVNFNNITDQTLSFNASAMAPGSNTDILDLGDSPSIDSPLTLDDSPFWNNWPVSLNPDDSVTDQLLFNVDVPAGTSAGLYAGSFTLQGFGENTGEYVSDTADFDVSVLAPPTSVPEPPTFLLLSLGLAAMAVLGVKKFGTA